MHFIFRIGAAALSVAAAAGAYAQTSVPPVPTTGPYPVACTNVEQDLSRVAGGDTAETYWRGAAVGDSERYVDTLLVAPANAIISTFAAPSDGDLFDRWANKTLTYVYLACYPTTASNARADYALPGAGVVPRMQRGSEAPILPATPARLPVLLYSHGYGGSPLSDNYLHAMTAFASWGSVVVAPFHGDLRYSVFGPNEIAASKAKAHIPVWSEFVAMQAVRPLSLSAGLDVMLSRADWRDRIDTDHVGAFGISQGGETLMLLGGAELNYGFLTNRHKRVTQDSRVKAAVGYVPYFGIDSVPAFGSDQGGADGVTLPFLALSGSNDPIAPANVVREALDRMAGPRGQVMLNGQGHDLDPGGPADILTWSLLFLNAWVDGNAAARYELTQIEHVDGGLDDHKVLYVDPTGGGAAGVDLNQHGLTGSWFEPATAGQGIQLEVFADRSTGTGLAFVGWFTYDTVVGGAERQRWYTAVGPVVSGQSDASLTIYRNTGGNFDAPPVTVGQPVGTAALHFDSCSSGRLAYAFTDGTGRTGTIDLTRLTQNVTCSTTNANATTNADFALSGNWYDPATSGQGLAVEVNPNSNVLFAAWYTYAPNGANAGAAGQRWYTVQGSFAPGSRSIPASIYETTGGAFDQPPPGQTSVLVGTATMTFQSCSSATLGYQFSGGSNSGAAGTLLLSRVGPAPPGCTP